MADRKSHKRKASKNKDQVIHDIEKIGKGKFRIKATRVKQGKSDAGKFGSLQKGKAAAVRLDDVKATLVSAQNKQLGCLVTLKLDAFSVETGIYPRELYLITSSFADLLETAAEVSGKRAIVDVRVSSIQEGCMSFQLLTIIIQNLSIDVGTSTADVLATVFSGLEVLLSFLAIRYARSQRGSDESAKLDDWLEDNAVPEAQRRVIRSDGFLESLLRLLTFASRSKKGAVTLVAHLPGKKKGKQGQTKLPISPDDIQRLEEHLEKNEEDEGSDSRDC